MDRTRVDNMKVTGNVSQYNDSQSYNEELLGATSTDAAQQSLVEQPVQLPDDLTDEDLVGEEAAADSAAVPAADQVDTDDAAAVQGDDPADDLADDVVVDEVPAGQEPTSDVLQEFRDALREKVGDWFVVHTYSGMENRVKVNLENRISSLNMEDFIFQVEVPQEEVSELSLIHI